MSSEFAKDSLSLEETNKLRISLGLKPLTDDSAPASKETKGDADAEERPNDKDAVAQENYRKRREEEARAKEEEEIRQRIAKAQNKRDLRKQLRGVTLGQVSDAGPSSSSGVDPNDSKSMAKWLKQTQKRAKENAAKRAKELEEQEAAALQAAASYGESDLSGLRVGHDIEDFNLQDGDETGRILTLRDNKILDGDEDELMDASLEQKDIDRRNMERKKGPKEYTGLDEEEDLEDAQLGRKKGVLSKYDADIKESGSKVASDGGFRLGGSTETSEERKENRKREMEEEARIKNRTLLNLDYAKNQEVSDYMQPGDVGFKKSKGKKKKRPQASRIKLEDGDDEGPPPTTVQDEDAMQVDSAPVTHTRRRAEERDNLVDDDELAASLAKARRAKAKKAAHKMTPQQIAENLAAQRKAEEEENRREGGGDVATPEINGSSENTRGDGDGDGGGMTFDATSEFIRVISQRPNEEEEREAARREERSRADASSSAGPSVVKSEPQDEGDALSSAVDADALLSRGEHGMQEGEDGDDDEEMELGEALEDGVDDDEEQGAEEIGTSAEASTSSGLSGTLNLLRSQGLIQGSTPEQLQREAAQKSYDAWKARHMAEEALKEEERRMSKLQGTAKDQSTREYENKVRELEEAKRAESRFKDYKPDVDIKYHDQNGRQLSNHEAWKLLSHTFHGKMPGKQKQMKYKKKVEEERKKEKLLAGDSDDLSKNFLKRQQRQGQAHMVLSVGARGNAPADFASQENLLGPNLIHQRVNKDNAKKVQKAAKKKDNSVDSPAASPAPMSMLSPPLPKIITSANEQQRSSPAVSTPIFNTGTPLASASASASPLPPSSATPAPQPPRMKPAFAPISASGNNSGSSSPAVPASSSTGGGFKLAFNNSSSSNANGKRKAEDQGRR
ncbi:unnamed protein product [Sympodiomycopsis kandeliae]